MQNTERVIRVAQVIGMAIDGGVEACIMNYYRHIDRTRVQFDFFVESTSKIIDRDEIEAMGGRVVIIPHYSHLRTYLRTLERLFREGNYDIVHSNMNALSVFVLYAAKRAGVGVRIAHSHSTSNKREWKKNIIKGLLRPHSRKFATDYIACSELAGRWLFGDKTFDTGRVHLLNNAISLSKFGFDPAVRDEVRGELGLTDSFVVGHVGRFAEQKNQRFLLEIFSEFQKQRPDARCLILGDGPLHDALVKKAVDLGIDGKVIFAGIQKYPERFYQAMDCFLLPSLYEGLPVSGIEAQVNGLPCFFSDKITAEARIGDCTWYCPLEAGAQGWAALMDEKCAETGGQRCEHVRSERFDIGSQAGKLLALYEQMLSPKNEAARNG